MSWQKNNSNGDHRSFAAPANCLTLQMYVRFLYHANIRKEICRYFYSFSGMRGKVSENV